MNAQTETQDAEVSTDGPLLDLTDAGVKKFIKQAKARGYVTMEELNKVLPSEEVTPDAIEDTLAMLSEMGVNVVEAEEDAEQKDGEGGEVAERCVVPARPVARQALVEVHVQHDAGIAAQAGIVEQAACHDDRRVRIGVQVDAAMADDLGAHGRRPILQSRLPEHEVAEDRAEDGVVRIAGQPGVGEVVHRPMLAAWREVLS